MTEFIKQLFCKHNYKADRIGWITNLFNGFICTKCGKAKL